MFRWLERIWFGRRHPLMPESEQEFAELRKAIADDLAGTNEYLRRCGEAHIEIAKRLMEFKEDSEALHLAAGRQLDLATFRVRVLERALRGR